MGKVRDHHRSLAVSYYDYQKTCDMVPHDWVLRLYEWIGIERKVRRVIEEVMMKWKTCREVIKKALS